MSHALAAETSFPGVDNVVYAGYVPERELAERSEVIKSSPEAGASGIASVWLAFYALAALIVVLAS
jgi:hypothetical protein